ncbi:MAG: type II toxin-antitoxin system VapC family toxin [Chloroflexi bacterium]|nr:type II toxin-antitoxin system VapC family toxin [Chloroflexota bacterium]
MPAVSTNPRATYSFQGAPPEIAYLDTSFVLNLVVKESAFHSECVNFAKQLKAAESLLVLSNLVLDEMWFVLLRLQAVQEQGQSGWLSFLRQHPEKIRVYAQRLEQVTQQILRIPNLLWIETTFAQSLKALTFVQQYGLLPRDALHATLVKDAGIGTLVTTDADFMRVEGITLYTCNRHVQGT